MFVTIFTSLFAAFIYIFFFYLSTDTPLKNATGQELVELVGFILVVSMCLSVSVKLLTKLLDNVASDKYNLSRRINSILVYLILYALFLLLLENWFYSVFGVALKTSVSWQLKLLFSLMALFLAHQFSAFIFYISKCVDNYKLSFALPFCGLVIASIWLNWMNFSNVQNAQESLGNIKNWYNVIILMSDGVNASETSLYGSEYDTTPFLSSIRSESMVFENTYTNNQNSTGSITSILTGVSPLTTKVVYPPDILTNPYSKRSLPRILGEFDYFRALWAVPHYIDADSQNLMGAFNSNNSRSVESSEHFVESKVYQSSPLRDFFGLPSVYVWYFKNLWKSYTGVIADVLFIRELDNPFEQVDESESREKSKNQISLTDKSRIKNLLLDIELASKSDKPFFILTHLMKTHGAKYHPVSQIFSAGKQETEDWMIDFYRDSILDFDAYVKQVYQQLQQYKQLENTIFIVASDHGARWSNINRVPLLIRLPHSMQAGSYSVNTQLIDIAPTILNVLGLEIPSWMEGQSLTKPDSVMPNRFIFSAGVSGNHIEEGVWVRNTKQASEFASGNKFSVIYCNYYMKSSYPIKYSLKELPDRLGKSKCKHQAENTIIAEAEKLVNSKISN